MSLKNRLTKRYGWLIALTGGDAGEIETIVHQTANKLPGKSGAYLYKAAGNEIKSIANKRRWVGSDFDPTPPDIVDTKTPETELSLADVKKICFSVCVGEKEKDIMVMILAGFKTRQICEGLDTNHSKITFLRKAAADKLVKYGYRP